MKILIQFLLFLSLASFTFACNNAEGTNYPKNFQESVRVVLEIDSLSYDSLGSPNGRNLVFRLFENGEFEYEEVSDEKLKEIEFQAFSSEVVSKKQGQLADEVLTQINELLNSPDFQKTHFYFKNAEGFCTCGATRLEIRSRNKSGGIKNILIDGSGCTDLRKPEAKMFPDFPKIISKLINKVHEVKYPDLESSGS